MPRTIHCHSLSQLGTIAKSLLTAYPNARIFCFYGSMGAGKTTFIKKFCLELGVKEVVNSPTFAIVNEYLRGEGESVYHFDLYRLKSWQEMLDIGYEDYFYSGSYCLIEWPEKIEQLLPEEAVAVKIEVLDEEERLFTF